MPASEVVGINAAVGRVRRLRAKERQVPRVRFEVGDAQALKFKDASFDNTLALLVMNFVPDENKAVAEIAPRHPYARHRKCMCLGLRRQECRCSGSFGTKPLRSDPAIEPKDERHIKLSRQGQLGDLWKKAGLTNIKEEPLVMDQAYSSFNDYWEPFTNGAGPGGAYVVSLSQGRREQLETRMRKHLLGDRRNSLPFTLKARAWCVRGEVPGEKLEYGHR